MRACQPQFRNLNLGTVPKLRFQALRWLTPDEHRLALGYAV
ncbi:hypothetical protein COLSTE_02434 [Collinsella stercoris DSM 13279]|uniref:Uncharacterized protein n=1 Tax=Collinsella stercoris DSM 13279 TaxID=445975 RepID=B6GE97_9ACTN|nr:hypothetical protein COLSTE_02434 [Collinsella stercoris DSM 13279]